MILSTANDLQIMGMLYEAMLEGNTPSILTSIKDLPDEKPYGFWLSPQADKFCTVRSARHEEVGRIIIRDNPALFKFSDTIGKEWSVNENDVYDLMYVNKWFRIQSGVSCMTYECPKIKIKGKTLISSPPSDSEVPTQRQSSWMEYVCGLYGISKIMDSMGRVVWMRLN